MLCLADSGEGLPNLRIVVLCGRGSAIQGADRICGSFLQLFLQAIIDLEKRARAADPLWGIRQIVNAALKSLSGEFAKLYSPIGRQPFPLERLIRAFIVQACYSIRLERQLSSESNRTVPVLSPMFQKSG